MASNQHACICGREMYVWFDGKTNPCDVDYKSQLSMGKLDYKNNIKKIWNSEFFNDLRKKHLNKERQSINLVTDVG